MKFLALKKSFRGICGMVDDNTLTLREEQQIVQLLSGYGFFLKRNYITRIDKLDALEMASVVLLSNN